MDVRRRGGATPWTGAGDSSRASSNASIAAASARARAASRGRGASMSRSDVSLSSAIASTHNNPLSPLRASWMYQLTVVSLHPITAAASAWLISSA